MDFAREAAFAGRISLLVLADRSYFIYLVPTPVDNLDILMG
jgi:hypothetical protein